MSNRNIALCSAVAFLLFGSMDLVAAENVGPLPSKSGYADVNGIKLYYEIYGGGARDAGWDGSLRPTAQLAILPVPGR